MLHQTISAAQVSRAELLAAFSYALDLTEGQPAGHSLRSCWIAMRVGQALELNGPELRNLYYTVLLKDLGCSSNAARICELYATDDRAFKQGYKTVGTSLASTLYFVVSQTARERSFSRRVSAVGNILLNGRDIAQDLIVSRCTRGAEIARMLRFSQVVCDGIYHLDEHWDGSGRPSALRGAAVPLGSQLALLAQVVDVFHTHAGPSAALDEAKRRAGSWFNPALVKVLEKVSGEASFWSALGSPTLELRVIRLAPPKEGMALDEDYLDDIVNAFGRVVDAKSPYTANHSARVAGYAGKIGRSLGIDPARTRWLQRAAALHDIGKLGVSSSVLEKPSTLDDREWVEMREHATHTRTILRRVGALAEFADVAAAHHERLDGRGYPLGLQQAAISRDTRIITTCDYFDALTSDRPYRAALPIDKAMDIIKSEVGGAIDADCYRALTGVVGTD